MSAIKCSCTSWYALQNVPAGSSSGHHAAIRWQSWAISRRRARTCGVCEEGGPSLLELVEHGMHRLLRDVDVDTSTRG